MIVTLRDAKSTVASHIAWNDTIYILFSYIRSSIVIIVLRVKRENIAKVSSHVTMYRYECS